MSAFVVSREHIAYLVQAAMTARIVGDRELCWCWGTPARSGVLAGGDFPTAAAVGQMLWAENIRSVSTRYPGDETVDDLPGVVPGDHTYGRHRNMFAPGQVTHAQVFKACDCYDYQACETDDYRQTEAAAFIQALRDAAIRSLPGYEQAQWEIEAKQAVKEPV